MSKLAIAWCLLNENVSTVILGASKIEQLEENLKSTELLPLLDESIQKELLLI
jgi:aryl-alcohol dehydrogenase-like predicted oxidoreductase